MSDTVLRIECGSPDSSGKRTVIARLGKKSHRDRFDTVDSFRREKFREKVIEKFSLDESAHEFLETRIVAAAEEAESETFKPVVTMLDSVVPSRVKWLWDKKIAIGKNNLLIGHPGLGKSLASLHIAAITSSTCKFPGSDPVCEPGGVVILTLEDDSADTLVPRLRDHNANLSRIAHVQGLTDVDSGGKIVRGIDLLHDIDAVRAAVGQVPNCKLLVIDTISDYVGADTDTHKNSDIRAVLNPLAALAAECRIANLCVSHLRKGDGPAIHAAMGSVGFVGQARVAWMITRCPDSPRRRLMTCVKNNLADDTAGLAFTIEPLGTDRGPVICWEAEPITMSADDAMAVAAKKRGPRPQQREDAATWLSKKLATGPKPAGEILKEGEGLGYSDSTIRRAFKQLGCDRRKGGFEQGWLWFIPEDVTEDVTTPYRPNNLTPSHLRQNTEDSNTHPIILSCSRTKVSGFESTRGADTFDEFEEERQAIIHESNGHSSEPPF